MKSFSNEITSPVHIALIVREAASANAWAAAEDSKKTRKLIITVGVINALITIASVAWLFLHFQ